MFSKRWITPIAKVFRELGANHVLVVHSRDGLDEISLAERTDVAELRDGEVTEYDIGPEDFGITRIDDIGALCVDSAEASLEMITAVLSGVPGPATDMVILNTGATLYAAGKADSIAAGVSAARDVLAGGAAMEKLQALARFTGQFRSD